MSERNPGFQTPSSFPHSSIRPGTQKSPFLTLFGTTSPAALVLLPSIVISPS